MLPEIESLILFSQIVRQSVEPGIRQWPGLGIAKALAPGILGIKGGKNASFILYVHASFIGRIGPVL